MQDLCHPLHILHNIAAYIRSYAQKIFFIDSNNKQKKKNTSLFICNKLHTMHFIACCYLQDCIFPTYNTENAGKY